MASKRLMNIADHMPSVSSSQKDSTIIDWTTAKIPTYDELPPFKNFPGCAWGVWGPEDQLGTVNLLTDTLVKRSSSEEIQTGKTVSLNWPLNFPDKPMFGRLPPEVKMIQKKKEGRIDSRDEEIHINTQSGTQWDGLRHFPILEHEVFYNNTPASVLQQGIHPIPDPQQIDPVHAHIGIQNWANHGICGRGVLLDLAKFLCTDGVLTYDPWTTHTITVSQLQACAKAQGVQFRRGDILILRVGFIKKYYESTQESRDSLRGKPETFAGIEQSEEMKRFLWDNHFAAVASDQPALESWPPAKGVPHMHQTILGLWGMPIGEFFDLEELSEVCAQYQRHSFFFSSWPLNIIGGAASPPNAAAFF
ncbi:putative cyclase-domain-containing protein [Mycena galericulata]|nr:putative cyclase-domain-containing protein [Mycena galericulata]